MSYIGSDAEQDNKNTTDFRRQRSSSNLIPKPLESPKLAHQNVWNDKQNDDTDSEISDSANFLAKGAFLLTPSHELTMDRAAMICEKMNFKGCFSLTKTATGILFKFSHPEDYQAVFKKGFHKVTGARFYKKVAIPCRPQKTFTLYVFDVPEDLPEEDIRHALYKFNSVVEVVRLIVFYQKQPIVQESTSADSAKTPKVQSKIDEQDIVNINKEAPPAPIRITLASVEEFNYLLQNGLDFYQATYFPTEANLPATAAKIATKKGTRLIDGSIPGRVRELLPVFDAAGFTKISAPASKIFKPRP
ncbi:CLUMA_CG015115, isoform A [Clunio marinus]|uniref:CLUMA_CG015115, isoform A n=1 Tax=Clunio marinus TaxID=568069 RepID=A0A1J1IRE9_9DIPT|nr:CLUMA_CG015115, isoform A [Clunio marinus]